MLYCGKRQKTLLLVYEHVNNGKNFNKIPSWKWSVIICVVFALSGAFPCVLRMTQRVGGCRETPMCALHRCSPNTFPPTLSQSQLFQCKPEASVMKYRSFSIHLTQWTDVWAAQKEWHNYVRFMNHSVQHSLLPLSLCLFFPYPPSIPRYLWDLHFH